VPHSAEGDYLERHTAGSGGCSDCVKGALSRAGRRRTGRLLLLAVTPPGSGGAPGNLQSIILRPGFSYGRDPAVRLQVRGARCLRANTARPMRARQRPLLVTTIGALCLLVGWETCSTVSSVNYEHWGTQMPDKRSPARPDCCPKGDDRSAGAGQLISGADTRGASSATAPRPCRIVSPSIGGCSARQRLLCLRRLLDR
jgi:hypothetical protein